MKNEERAVKLFTGVTGVGDDLIEEAQMAQRRKKVAMRRRWGMIAACFLAITLSTSGTAFAASEDFRQLAISFFFPVYTENELHEIDEGHRTGSFSMEDTLFTFLEKFNTEHMAGEITVKNENGFEYVVLAQNENSINVIASCTTPDDKLFIIMERTNYKETTGLWQVTAYQILDREAANELIDNGQ